MKNKHLNFTAKNKSRQTRGFTIAAGICLIAIGVAAWAAYDSVVQEPQTIDSPVSISETQPSATPTPEPAPTPTPESDGRARKRSEGCPRLGVPSGVDFARTRLGDPEDAFR